MMVAAQVIGNDACVAFAGSQGNLELNVMMPVMGRNLLESARLLANAARLLADKVVDGAEADVERAREYAESSPSVVTPLNRYLGYEEAASIAKQSLKERRTIREVVLERGHVQSREADRRAARRRTGRAGHGPRRRRAAPARSTRADASARPEALSWVLRARRSVGGQLRGCDGCCSPTSSPPPPRSGPPAPARRSRQRWPPCCGRPSRTRSSRPPRGWPASRGRAGSAPAGAPWPGSTPTRPPVPSLHGRGGRRARSTSWPRTSGAGSTARRAAPARGLFGAATADEQAFLRRLLTGELRQGALEGVMLEAIAAAAEVPAGGGAAGVHALRAAAAHRPARARPAAPTALDAVSLQVGVPVRPMLASPADTARRRAGRAGRRGQRRVQARRRPHPGAPRRRRGAGVDPHAARDHRGRAGARRAGPRAARAGRSCSTARRSRCATTAGRARSRRR